MVLLGVVDAESAFFSEETGVDWNVIFLLFGMMVIVSVIRRTGAFEYLAIWSAKRVRGRPFPLMVMLVVLTAIASALLDNVTTVLLVAPVTMLVCERLGLPAVPFLIAEVMASNIGGMATLIGDPPNIIIASRSGPDVQRLPHPSRAARHHLDGGLRGAVLDPLGPQAAVPRGAGRGDDAAG